MFRLIISVVLVFFSLGASAEDGDTKRLFDIFKNSGEIPLEQEKIVAGIFHKGLKEYLGSLHLDPYMLENRTDISASKALELNYTVEFLQLALGDAIDDLEDLKGSDLSPELRKLKWTIVVRQLSVNMLEMYDLELYLIVNSDWRRTFYFFLPKLFDKFVYL